MSLCNVMFYVKIGLSLSTFMLKEGCICPEPSTVVNLTYECTTVGPGSTLWKGSAFNCAENGDEVALRHSLFSQPGGTTVQCNNGNIMGQSLRVENNLYTSRLHVVFNTSLLGRSIQCVHFNLLSEEIIGSATIATIRGTPDTICYHCYSIVCIFIYVHIIVLYGIA